MLADADDERTLVHIIGAPALPVGPRMRPVPSASREDRSAEHGDENNQQRRLKK